MDGDVYRLGYRWTVVGPLETVFHYVTDARTFRDWFPVFKVVRADDQQGEVRVGSHVTARVKALLPYVLDWDITVARHEPPWFQETSVMLSLNGRFRMRGYVRYRFEQRPSSVVVVYNEQALAADQPLPRILHPFAQAVFSLNHAWAMSQALAPLRVITASGQAR
jgi:hypothetical protein